MDYSRLFRLDGRVSFVAGAGSGIGRAAAFALAAHGAQVICADRDGKAAEQTADTIGEQARAYYLDILDGAAISAASAEFPNVETLVFTPATNVRKRLLDYTAEEYERVMAMNLRAGFDLVRAFGQNMVHRESGSIIGFSSIRNVLVEPGQGPYAATKSGIVQLLRTAAAEFGPSGVRANAIAPGIVRTPLTQPVRNNSEWHRAYAEKNALRRWSDPEEVAGAVVYLASEAASYVTGTVLYVDGGWTAVDGRYEPPDT